MLHEERMQLRASLENNHSHALASCETRWQEQCHERLEELKARQELMVGKVSEQLKAAVEEAARERAEGQKQRMEFAEKKRALEERLIGLDSRVAVELKATEQKYQGKTALLLQRSFQFFNFQILSVLQFLQCLISFNSVQLSFENIFLDKIS